MYSGPYNLKRIFCPILMSSLLLHILFTIALLTLFLLWKSQHLFCFEQPYSVITILNLQVTKFNILSTTIKVNPDLFSNHLNKNNSVTFFDVKILNSNDAFLLKWVNDIFIEKLLFLLSPAQVLGGIGRGAEPICEKNLK